MRERVREQSIGRSFGLGLLLVVAMACVVPASAFAATAHEYKGSFGPDCTGATKFESPGAVAVDEANHNVYVADQSQPLESVNEVFRCTTSGAEAKFTAGSGAGTNHIGGIQLTRGEPKNQIAVSPTNHHPSSRQTHIPPGPPDPPVTEGLPG